MCLKVLIGVINKRGGFMTLKNSLRFGIIMALVMCTMFYIFPMPETFVWKTLFCLIIVGVGLLLSYFILGKENMKKK